MWVKQIATPVWNADTEETTYQKLNPWTDHYVHLDCEDGDIILVSPDGEWDTFSAEHWNVDCIRVMSRRPKSFKDFDLTPYQEFLEFEIYPLVGDDSDEEEIVAELNIYGVPDIPDEPVERVEDDLPWSDDSDEEIVVKPVKVNRRKTPQVMLDRTPVEIETVDCSWTHYPHQIHRAQDISRKILEKFWVDYNHLDHEQMILQALEFAESTKCPGFTYNRNNKKVYFHKTIEGDRMEDNTRRCNWHHFYQLS